jgi:hypothetical protein
MLIQFKSQYARLIFLSINLIIACNANAEFKRSQKAKNLFKAENPCPATGNAKGSCPGYIIDHIQPLACNGADDPSNMQWQTKEEAKLKDKWERIDCKVL